MIRDEDGLLAGYVYVDIDPAARDVGGYVDDGEARGARAHSATASSSCPRATCSSGPASTSCWSR